mmetsp:Transcript_2518/g.3425  ORF Transcript_2518/g.3425 Transcript_2518/m.3425 type:complete len:134 (+) Transcript_2518:39-440(+)
MFSKQILRSFTAKTFHQSIRSLGGQSHHGPLLPPLARIPRPSKRVPEENELVWDDGVAPEVCLDFDAPNVSTSDAFKWWLGGIGIFVAVYQAIKMSDPENLMEAAPRKSTLPRTSFDPYDIFTGKRSTHLDDE